MYQARLSFQGAPAGQRCWTRVLAQPGVYFVVRSTDCVTMESILVDFRLGDLAIMETMEEFHAGYTHVESCYDPSQRTRTSYSDEEDGQTHEVTTSQSTTGPLDVYVMTFTPRACAS